MSESIDVSIDEATATASAVLLRLGAPDEVARLVADQLVDADTRGHTSHGVSRLPWYSRYVADGVVVPGNRPKQIAGGYDSAIKVSGEWGFGQAAAYLATDLAIERARQYGVAAASVVRCTHVGRMGAYVERASDAGCVAFATVGGMRGAGVAVPFGGSQPLLGPSPIAAAFPATDDPLVLDFSTTEVALGKVMVAKQSGTALPTLGLVEADGTPTDDPTALERGGALRTFGAHKGFALATMAELLGSVLTGADDHRDDGPGGPAFRGAGMTLIVLSADAFGDAGTVRSRAEALRADIRSIPPAPGHQSVMAPGDPEQRSRRRHHQTITVPAATWAEIVGLLDSEFTHTRNTP